MATAKVRTIPKTKRLRVPSDQEMEPMGMLWSYARVRRIGRDHGLDRLEMPREFRVAKPPQERPPSDKATEKEIRRLIDDIKAQRGRGLTERQRRRGTVK